MAQLFQPLFFQRLFQQFSKGIALTVLTLLAADLPLQGQPIEPLPTPEAALEQAEQLSAEEITRLEIDEVTRDRLRFDPAWQPIREAVQRDLMIIKWGDGQLDNPVWQQYGAKVYPLLDYYARSADPTRQIYGVVGLRALGKPYTTLWLERQLQRSNSNLNFYWLREDPTYLFQGEYNPSYDSESWKQAFGLDDPASRDRLLQIARDNLKPITDPDYYSQFNLSFIEAVAGTNPLPPPPPPPFNPALDPALGEWNQLELLPQPTTAQARQGLAIYQNLAPRTQEYLLVQRLGRVEAGAATRMQILLLRQLAADPAAAERVWAIAELDRHSDPEGSQLLQEILNGDLSQLNALAQRASYESVDYSEASLAKATHAYYLLLGMAEKYPQSKFIRAAREYGDLTGRSYFGSEPRSQAVLDRIARQTPSDRVAAWSNWLSQYPDHPGADDATYFMARSLQDQGAVVAATELWVNLMTQPIGDGDATYLAYPQIRTLLDIGLDTAQLEAMAQLYQGQSIEPLFRYALAVRQARSHDYAQALQTSNGLDLAQMPPEILGSYYNKIRRWYGEEGDLTSQVQQQMQAMLTDQRLRWQNLQQLQAVGTPEAEYELASDWAGEGGWKNGYLAVWEDSRTNLLPTGSWGSFYCREFWVCNEAVRGSEVVRSSYQQASQNAIALAVYQSVLDNPQTSAALREKILYMTASTVLWQWEDHPYGETLRIHPLPGMTVSDRELAPLTNAESDSFEQWQAIDAQLQREYDGYVGDRLARLQQEFPQSPYIDDLLFSRYALNGDRQYLQQIVDQYPQSDRAAEARFLLTQPAPSEF